MKKKSERVYSIYREGSNLGRNGLLYGLALTENTAHGFGFSVSLFCTS